MPRDREGPGEGLRLHGQGEPRRRDLERNGGPGSGRHRAARRQAGHGGEGGPLQALRRHRRLRHRGGRERPAGLRGHRGVDRADLRGHQSRGHQIPRVLLDRGGAEASPLHPGLPRRPARHGHHLRRGALERARGRREEDRRRQGGLRRRGRFGDRLREALPRVRRAPGEPPDGGQGRRHLRRPPGGPQPLQAAVRRRDLRAHARRCAFRSGRPRRALDEGDRHRRHAPQDGARSDRLRPREPGARDHAGGGAGGAPGRRHGDGAQRLSEPGQQRARLPLPLPRRARRRGLRDQRADEEGGLAGARGAREDGRARLGLAGVRRADFPLRPQLSDSKAFRLPRAALGRAGSGRGGDAVGGRAPADHRHERLPAAARSDALAHAGTDERRPREGEARPEADRLPRGGAPEDPARREDPGGGGDLPPDSARPRAEGGRPRAGAAAPDGPDRARPHGDLAEAPAVRGAPGRAAAPFRRDGGLGGAPRARAQLLTAR